MAKRRVFESGESSTKRIRGVFGPPSLDNFPGDILRHIFEYVIPSARHDPDQEICAMECRTSAGLFGSPMRSQQELICVHFIIDFLRLRHTCRRFMHLLASRTPRLERAWQGAAREPSECAPIVYVGYFMDYVYLGRASVARAFFSRGPMKAAHPLPLVNHPRNFWNRPRIRRIIFDALTAGARKWDHDHPNVRSAVEKAHRAHQQPPVAVLFDRRITPWSAPRKFLLSFYLCRVWRLTHDDEGYHEGHLRTQLEERLRARGYTETSQEPRMLIIHK